MFFFIRFPTQKCAVKTINITTQTQKHCSLVLLSSPTTQNESFNGVEIYFYWIELLKRANFNTHFFIAFSIHKRNKNQMFLLCSEWSVPAMKQSGMVVLYVWRKTTRKKGMELTFLFHSLKRCDCVGCAYILLSLSSSMVCFYSIYMLFRFIIMASVLLSWLCENRRSRFMSVA